MGKKFSITLLVIGIILVALAIVWWAAIAPALVKLPDDIDTRMTFEGALTLYVDSETGTPLTEDQAVMLPLTVDRTFVALPDLYTSDTAVFEDTVIMSIMGEAGQPQVTHYALDRATRKCVDSPENWAYSPQILLDRTGNYGALLPGGLQVGDTASAYFNDPSQVFDIEVVEAIDDWHGLGITALKIDATRPWADYNPAIAQAVLIAGQGLPAEITYDQLAARLKAAGLDLGQLVAGLAMVASAEDQQAIAGLMGQTFALTYKQSSADVYYIEQKTGATVGATFDRTTGMSVDTSGLTGAIAILSKYAQDPTVGPAITEALAGAASLLTADPTKVFNQNISIVSTGVGSEEALAQSAKDKIPLLSLVNLWIPVIIVAIGGLILLLGIVGLLVGSRTKAAA